MIFHSYVKLPEGTTKNSRDPQENDGGHFESWTKFYKGQTATPTLWGMLLFTMNIGNPHNWGWAPSWNSLNIFRLFQSRAQPQLCEWPRRWTLLPVGDQEEQWLSCVWCVWGKQEQWNCSTSLSHLSLFYELDLCVSSKALPWRFFLVTEALARL